MENLSVGLVGTKFMGRAHSNAFLKAPHFFNLPLQPILKAACGHDAAGTESFARQFGWQTTEPSWEQLVARDDIDLVDICTPNVIHAPIAIAAAKAGKHVFCEKPLAMNAGEARQMMDAANEAGVRHMVAFNYRRAPAVALARQLIDQGKIGQVRHFNAVYYQDWLIDPDFSFVWRHDVKVGGSGAHGDMSAHIVDLARYLVGEFEAVSGSQSIFIKERPLADGSGRASVTADDATNFIARFRNGALGAFLVSRLATGRKNFLRFELFGSEGAISFNLERMNELEYYSVHDPIAEQGFRTIVVTDKTHPYMNAWWPPGHIIGWEHTFVHEVVDLIHAIAYGTAIRPDFYDGYRCQQVLDAVIQSGCDDKWTTIPDD